MRGRKFSSPKDNNSDAIAIKNVIQEIAQEEIRKFGFPTYKAAIVRKINEDGTVDCYLPPNEDNLVTGILNKCGELLFVGDSVELETKNGSLTNCWVAIKHGTNVQGQAEEVENLSGEVVMKVQNGRLSVTELNRDAVLGNAFTIIAEDINLDGMNIVLNGSRGITITSPYFNVTSQGYITATGGKIGGWEMGATRLYSGTGANYVALDSGTANVNYPIWAGNENPANAPFSVTRGGTIKATNGTIGSFTLNTTRLYSGSGNTTAGIGVSGSDYAFWAGGDTSSSAPYRVSHGGALTATNANITGTITTGDLTATGGNIAGWTINNEAIFNGKGIGESGSLGLSTAFSDWAFWAGNGAFRVTQGGQLNASNVSITGGTLSIGSRFYVNSSGQFRAYTSSGGYIHMGLNTTNPSVSGLNVDNNGISMNGTGISHCSGLTGTGNVNVSADSQLDISGNTMRIRAKSGMGYMVFLKGDATTGFTGLDVYNLIHPSSSKNVKKDIKKISNKEEQELYDTLKSTSMYEFKYKNKYDSNNLKEIHHGFIIEEIENTIFNNYLHFKQDSSDSNIKTYDGQELSKLNLILIKILQDKIDKQEEEIKELKKW